MIDKMLKELTDAELLDKVSKDPICPYYIKTDHERIGVCYFEHSKNYKQLVKKEDCIGEILSGSPAHIYYKCGIKIPIISLYNLINEKR